MQPNSSHVITSETVNSGRVSFIRFQRRLSIESLNSCYWRVTVGESALKGLHEPSNQYWPGKRMSNYKRRSRSFCSLTRVSIQTLSMIHWWFGCLSTFTVGDPTSSSWFIRLQVRLLQVLGKRKKTQFSKTPNPFMRPPNREWTLVDIANSPNGHIQIEFSMQLYVQSVTDTLRAYWTLSGTQEKQRN